MNQDKFNQLIHKFENAKDKKDRILNIDYLLIKQNAAVYSHKFKKEDTPSDIRSISKTVLTMIAGILMDLSEQGKYSEFDWDTYVFPILEKVVHLRNTENKEKLSNIKVKHLLNHTVGFDKVLLMRGDIVDRDPFTYLDYIINEPIQHDPGTHYLYSNAGFYLLSAVLQEFIQEDLLEFAHKHLFQALDIKNYVWEKYGNYLAGATRLWMFPEDLMKIGEVLLNKGLYDKQRIISEKYIDKMIQPTYRTKSSDTPNATYRRYAYASGIWLAKESIFFGHGTDGQCLVMIPKKNAIIITLSSQSEVSKLESLINEIITEYL